MSSHPFKSRSRVMGSSVKGWRQFFSAISTVMSATSTVISRLGSALTSSISSLTASWGSSTMTRPCLEELFLKMSPYEEAMMASKP